MLESGEVDYVERDDVFVRKAGSAFPVAYAAMPVLLEGEIRGVVLVLRDVTQATLEWGALRAREGRLRRLTEASLEVLVVHDGKRIVGANRATSRCLGDSQKELDGKPVVDLIAAAL